MKSPTILVFATQFMPTGGIESHLREFCLNLSESGVIVDLAISNANMSEDTERFFKQICRNVYLGKKGKSSLRFLWLLGLGVRLSLRKYDALYTNGQGSSIGLFAKMLIGKKKWVHHHHTSGDASDRATWSEKYKQALYDTNAVIACSTRNAKDIQGALNRNIDSIPCFSREVIINSNRKLDKKLHFGYYGRFIPEKGIDVLCKLSNDPDLNHIQIHLWGEGENYPPSFFEKFANVAYHGTFNGKEELVQVITSLDALLLITTNPEGLPIILLEAMSAGLPWLSTDQGGIPDIALDKDATRVIPSNSDYETVKNAVISLAADIQSGKISNAAQKQLYLEKFSSSALIVEWCKMLGISKTV